MARAAVLPPSPAKRAPRTASAKGNAGGRKGKTSAPKKGASTVVSAAAAARTAAIADSDDTDDELGMMMEEPASKPAPKSAKPRGRPPRPAAKATTSTRGKKTASASAPATTPMNDESNDESDDTAEPEPPKKRVGRPRKNPVPEEVPTKTEAAPKPRGRPKGSGTKSTTTATRKGTRKAAEAETATDNDEPKHFMIATNSTTMRSNILRGPAKKKTVTFQDVSDSDGEDAEEPVADVTGRRKTPARNTGAGGKTGLRATPVRKATTSARGRKPAAAKKAAAQPLSPKKEKQMAKSLSAYASSDGDEDELSAVRDDFKSPVKLHVHSPTKPPSEHMGLSSPVRKVNFTPNKASLVDENGEPKLPTPKHGSATTGLSSPVRKINFTPNRSHHAVADNGHLALPPGKSIDFSDSVFMSSPARRPEASPFQFTLRGTPHKGLAKSIPAPNFTPGQPSPLKASPKKGHLATSFSGSPSKSTPAFPARSSLFLSPAKRPASLLKHSLFSSGVRNQGPTQTHGGDVASTSWPSPPKPTPAEESAVDQDLEMVEEVARDIFGIEISSGNSASSESRLSTEVVEPQIAVDVDLVNVEQGEHRDAVGVGADEVDEKLQELEEEIRREPDDMGTICFSTMEELQEPFQNLEPENDVDEEAQMEEVDCEYEEIASVRTPEAEIVLDYAELVDEEQQDQSSHNMPSSPSEPALGLNTLEDARPPASVYTPGDVEEGGEHVDYLHPYDEETAESEEDVDNDEPTLVPSEATFTISSQLRSPYRVSEAGGNSPLRRSSIPPFVPTPPVRETTPAKDMPSNSPVGPSSAKSIDRLFDINYEPRVEFQEDSLLDTTQSEIPTPRAPRASETPRTRTQRKSVGIDLGFTPLAQQFGGWAADTPSQDRPARPRRRGVFSLVGPLGKPIEDTMQDAGDISYPDLSRTSLANTPRLFAELPHSVSGRDSMASLAVSRSQSPATEQDEDMMDSPTKSEIFEDPEPAVAGTDHALSPAVLTPDMTNDEDQSDDDKENSDTPSFVPPTTPVRAVSAPRTVHTVSKVPLKAEGEVSPIKLPRKRGLSLSNASPTRFSPRIRNSPRVGSPSSSPHKVSRVARSPSPKRRCSTPRRSSVKLPAIASKPPSLTPSPSKTPRRLSQQALRGAVVHVDVHTTEGEDASGIFVELLQQMGARCVKSWSWNPSSSLSPVDGQDPKDTSAKVGITHVVYKDGGLRTLEKVKHAAGLVKCVGVGWVLDCERENKWLDETPYAVDSSIIPRGGAKRRKSMEPRALNNVNGTLVRAAEPSTPSASGRRCGADWGAMESFRKITPPVQAPATPEQDNDGDRYQIPRTPGYNFANLDAIGTSPATPYFLSSRAQLVQRSCPPKQSQQGLFSGPKLKPMSNLFEDDDDDERRKQRARMEAARRKTNIFKPAVGSPLGR